VIRLRRSRQYLLNRQRSSTHKKNNWVHPCICRRKFLIVLIGGLWVIALMRAIQNRRVCRGWPMPMPSQLDGHWQHEPWQGAAMPQSALEKYGGVLDAPDRLNMRLTPA
jgi:hypothetical protein